MRGRILIAALLVTGIWAVARTKPTPDSHPVQAARQILLVDGGRSDLPVVSDLEAGQSRLALVRKPVPRAVRSPEKAAAGVAAAEAVSTELVPEVRPTISSTTEALHHMAMAPLPVAPAPGLGTLASSGDFDGRETPVEHSRDPAIIIRGGMGGARDNCDLHRRGAGGYGIAINRSAPQLGGIELGRTGMTYPRGTRIR